MMSRLSGGGGGHSTSAGASSGGHLGASKGTAADPPSGGGSTSYGPNSQGSSTSPVRHNHLTYQHGHSFIKKIFHRPNNCHYCGDRLWGLMDQGYTCEGRPYKSSQLESIYFAARWQRYRQNSSLIVFVGVFAI